MQATLIPDAGGPDVHAQCYSEYSSPDPSSPDPSSDPSSDLSCSNGWCTSQSTTYALHPEIKTYLLDNIMGGRATWPKPGVPTDGKSVNDPVTHPF
jgi:hypothetical protein